MKVKVTFKILTGMDGVNYNPGDTLIMEEADVSKKKISNHVTVQYMEEKKEVK